MILKQKPMFKRAYKKLYPQQKKLVDLAIKEIIENPSIGTQKKQDLKDIFIYKFKVLDRQFLLAYMFDPETLTLVFLGVNENYYRDFKKNIK